MTIRSLLFALLFPGCIASVQGIRARAVSPQIDEAFRKMSLAATLDGYEIEAVDPARHSLRTAWRLLKDREYSESDRGFQGVLESRVILRMDGRGGLYDVLLTPEMRYTAGEKEEIRGADVQHPLWAKWTRTLEAVVEKEVKEED